MIPVIRMRTTDAPEHVDVLIVGAGLSGVGAACHLQRRCPGKTYTILEGRDSIGGTWDLFRYPGVRSDSDMHTLGYSFRPWDDPQAIADGPSILRYIKDTAADFGVSDRIRLGHRVVSADWSSEGSRWTVTAERTATGETVELTAGFAALLLGLLPLRRGLHAAAARRRAVRGRDRPSSALAGGSGLCGQARGRDR